MRALKLAEMALGSVVTDLPIGRKVHRFTVIDGKNMIKWIRIASNDFDERFCVEMEKRGDPNKGLMGATVGSSVILRYWPTNAGPTLTAVVFSSSDEATKWLDSNALRGVS